MDKAEAIKLAKDYKELVKKHLPVEEVYLYGSYATNTQHADSDIDIAVFVKKLRMIFRRHTIIVETSQTS